MSQKPGLSGRLRVCPPLGMLPLRMRTGVRIEAPVTDVVPVPLPILSADVEPNENGEVPSPEIGSEHPTPEPDISNALPVSVDGLISKLWLVGSDHSTAPGPVPVGAVDAGSISRTPAPPAGFEETVLTAIFPWTSSSPKFTFQGPKRNLLFPWYWRYPYTPAELRLIMPLLSS